MNQFFSMKSPGHLGFLGRFLSLGLCLVMLAAPKVAVAGGPDDYGLALTFVSDVDLGTITRPTGWGAVGFDENGNYGVAGDSTFVSGTPTYFSFKIRQQTVDNRDICVEFSTTAEPDGAVLYSTWAKWGGVAVSGICGLSNPNAFGGEGTYTMGLVWIIYPQIAEEVAPTFTVTVYYDPESGGGPPPP